MLNSGLFKPAALLLAVGVFGFAPVATPHATAAESKDPAAVNQAEGKIELTPVEKLIFDTEHMKNASAGQTLKYSFERKGQLGDDFTDTVELRVRKGDQSSGKTVDLEFFTGSRRKPYPDFSNVTANPLLTVFFNKDAWYLARRIKAKGTANYLRNRILDGLHEVKSIKDATCSYGGKDVPAKSITFAPFAQDKNKHHLVHYHAIEYTILLASDVPGGLCSITSVIPDQKEGVPDHYVARLKKQGMRELAGEADKVNLAKGKGLPILTETLSFVDVVKSAQANAEASVEK